MTILEKIKSDPLLRKWGLWLLKPTNDHRPRWWIRYLVTPFYHTRGKASKIRKSARLDVFPSKRFVLGDYSLIEDFTTINNGVGDVCIGNHTIIGIGSVVIGPVDIGNNVLLAQHVAIAGLNHGYENIHVPPRLQGDNCKLIIIEDEVWIGANSVITAGVRLGKHCVVAAGSVVTKDVPAYSVVGGNPARILKKFNSTLNIWERL
ncbi:acyltransferase [Olivibacter ginsenosidimutans]|uniref:Acyltransferase n=1 Tax=Olivibacter ginsenosidimutans TaxID=1176537 RepID=A0ABP9ADM0_9SPHI